MTVQQESSRNVAELPGKLGDASRELGTDPRSDPRMVAALAAFGMDRPAPNPPVTEDSPIEEQLAWAAATEEAFEGFYTAVTAGLPEVPGVTRETVQIEGPDGGSVSLYIHRPAETQDQLPAVFHTHGGGMIMVRGTNPVYVRWRDELAATGLVVVGVEFRNGAGILGPHPYPAGLDDCVAGLRWVLDNKQRLNISRVVLNGESGGANLALALGIRANREGWADEIGGIYAQAPYISNLWRDRPLELASLYENDGYFTSAAVARPMGSIYDPAREHAEDGACWPYFATESDLTGLPPHVISVNELDPFRDEGVAYHRRLVAAGVSSVGISLIGTCHAGDALLPGALPDFYAGSVWSIHSFAHHRTGR